MASTKNTIFGVDGKLTEDAMKMCQSLCYDPQKLQQRTLQHFQKDGVADSIAALRLQEYEQQRKQKLTFISEGLK